MKGLNNRQVELGTAIREIVPPPDSESWGHHMDLTRAVAKILDSSRVLTNPREVQKSFQAAWAASAGIWLSESHRILRDSLGGQDDFDRVQEHPNGRKAFSRILDRVKETHGELQAGMAVEVDDILLDLDIIEEC